MKIRKFLIAATCVLTIAASTAVSASAAEPDTAVPPVTTSPAAVISPVEPQADQIETYYRYTWDNKLQKRRWNATRGYWVDPYWITISL